jgi:outer membrane immunogenic protein
VVHPVEAQGANWTGFYVGDHVGWGWAESKWAAQNNSFFLATSSPQPVIRPNGGVGGVQAGFNYQRGQWLVGVDGTWSLTGLSQTVVSPSFPLTDHEQTEIKDLITIAGRVGAVFLDSLWYVKGGWAGGRVALTATSTFGGNTTWHEERNRSGWVVGAGVERMVAPHVVLGIDYNYIDLGTKNYAGNNVGANTTLTNVNDHTKVQTVVVRLSYSFGGR